MNKENSSERSLSSHIGQAAIKLALMGVGLALAWHGYEKNVYLNQSVSRAVDEHCERVIQSIPKLPGIEVTEVTWQSCRDVYLAENRKYMTGQIIEQYAYMGAGGIITLYEAVRLLSGLPFRRWVILFGF